MSNNISGHFAPAVRSMVPVVKTKKRSPDLGTFTFEDKLTPVENYYSTYIISYIIFTSKLLPIWKPSKLEESQSSVRKVGNHQEQTISLHSRQKGRPSTSCLNCLSMIAWLASYSMRASQNHFSHKLMLPAFRVKWRSSGWILSSNHLDSKVPH